ncbi:MAG: hypothetical protein KatS3mg023_0873 [Armatimonadota bacterium]|nr:MAG: hypothetical protein KatS3mg023_0873 [Armatimonadota bacterium]
MEMPRLPFSGLVITYQLGAMREQPVTRLETFRNGRYAGGRSLPNSYEGDQYNLGQVKLSPDGKWLAASFIPRADSPGGRPKPIALAIGETANLSIRRVTPDAYQGDWRWSPNSKYVATTGYEQVSGLHVVEVATGRSRRLAGKADCYFWSPDSQRLVYGVWQGRGEQLFYATSVDEEEARALPYSELDRLMGRAFRHALRLYRQLYGREYADTAPLQPQTPQGAPAGQHLLVSRMASGQYFLTRRVPNRIEYIASMTCLLACISWMSREDTMTGMYGVQAMRGQQVGRFITFTCCAGQSTAKVCTSGWTALSGRRTCLKPTWGSVISWRCPFRGRCVIWWYRLYQ